MRTRVIAGLILGGAVILVHLRATPQEQTQSSVLSPQSSVSSPQSSVLSPQSCLSCHKNIEPMHESGAVRLGCTDCHGGDATATTKEKAHVLPRHPQIWKTSANPPRTYTALLDESPEFVKFVNPGDLRVAQETCGNCHQKEVNAVPRSTMTTSAVFWAAVGYANGILSRKTGLLGESYNRDG